MIIRALGFSQGRDSHGSCLGAQWLSGPIVAIPITVEGEHPPTFNWYVLPDRLDPVVELKVEEERRPEVW